MANYFTKWMEAIPAPNHGATTIALTLVNEFVSRFRTPLQLQSDQGRNFESAFLPRNVQNYSHWKDEDYALHPENDGMFERFNRTLEDMIANVVDGDQKNWADCIPLAMMVYRSAIHESTGLTSADLMLCHKHHSTCWPSGTYNPRGRAARVRFTTEYANRLEDRLRILAFAIAGAKQKRNHDRQINHCVCNIGDPIWLHYAGGRRE